MLRAGEKNEHLVKQRQPEVSSEQICSTQNRADEFHWTVVVELTVREKGESSLNIAWTFFSEDLQYPQRIASVKFFD